MDDRIHFRRDGAAQNIACAFKIGVQHLVGTFRIGGNHCRAMNDGVATRQRVGGRPLIGDVTDDEIAHIDADLFGTGAQTIPITHQEPRLMSVSLDRLRGPRSDESRTARDQNFHRSHFYALPFKTLNRSHRSPPCTHNCGK